MKSAVVFVLLSVMAFAQPRQQNDRNEKPKNLRVLPDTLMVNQVRGMMFEYGAALGVKCGFCHVPNEPGVMPDFDFPNDSMPTKRIAREMIKMTKGINANIAAAFKISGDKPAEVTCATCHHGTVEPKRLDEVLWEDELSGGIEKAIAHFRELRAQYYGGYAYDFREGSLVRFAERCGMEKKFDHAVTALQVSAEFFPDSPRTMSTLAWVYIQSQQTDKAKPILEKVLKVDPNNRQAKRLMDEISKK